MGDIPSKHAWRLIKSPAASGAWNMAVDEAILEAVGKGEAPPTLRLYAWTPPCLSLGFAQEVADVDREALARRGWELVRRPTGGRAILHTDELTYSITGSHDEPLLAGSILESYQRISTALLETLRLLNVPARTDPNPAEAPDRSKGPVCFEVPSNYEITVDGKKLIGSAQARRKEGVLQHGSLPLFGDITRITQVLHFAEEGQATPEDLRQRAAERLLKRATTVERSLGIKVTWETAAQAMATAFQKVLDLDSQELSKAESIRAGELVRDKYGHPSWTDRV